MPGALLLVGAASYSIDDRGAAFLVEWIRQLAGDDDAGLACVALADEIEANSGEPIELGWPAIEGLCAYVLRDYLVQGHAELTALYYALRRYRGDPVLPDAHERPRSARRDRRPRRRSGRDRETPHRSLRTSPRTQPRTSPGRA